MITVLSGEQSSRQSTYSPHPPGVPRYINRPSTLPPHSAHTVASAAQGVSRRFCLKRSGEETMRSPVAHRHMPRMHAHAVCSHAHSPKLPLPSPRNTYGRAAACHISTLVQACWPVDTMRTCRFCRPTPADATAGMRRQRTLSCTCQYSERLCSRHIARPGP